MKIIIANSNPIHIKAERKCAKLFNSFTIHTKDQLVLKKLEEIKPDYIFFLHWSYRIPKEIFENFNCVLFHMTDLPYGRGGSPLQNLILRGHSKTILAALKVEEGIDSGPIYLKRPLSLAGTAEEIFLRSGKIMIEMIKEIATKNLIPVVQSGNPIVFKRRTPSESNIQTVNDIETIYDYIRMLDAENYPKAFIETEFFKFEFSSAIIKAEGILAEVKITKK